MRVISIIGARPQFIKAAAVSKALKEVGKRKAHLSEQSRTGKIIRNEALEELEKPLYDEVEFVRDYEFVFKKLRYTEEEFTKIMRRDPVLHGDYPNSMKLFYKLRSHLKK